MSEHKENCQKLLAEAIRKLADCGDTELAHSEADELLCHALEIEGFGEAVAEFRKMKKWYA